MPKKFSQRTEDLRRALAQEAARIMAEHGIEDFLQAKRKAADRLGVQDVAVLPKNVEIEAAHRVALNERKTTFPKILADNKLSLALDQLVPYAHWITPEGMPKRFDTWFFLASAPPAQLGAHDGRESTDSIWVSPREALEGGETGRFKLPFPTTRNLIRLGKQPNVRAALDDSRGKPVVTVMPVMTRLNGGRQLRIPLEAGYDGEVFEVGALG